VARYETLAVPHGTANLDLMARTAVEVLRAGGVLGHPTDTVYGIGGAAHAEVDRRVAKLKGRSLEESPILRIVLDGHALRTFYPDLEWTEQAERLAARFWPGSLTIVLDDGSGRSVAVRAEGHPVVRAVLREWNAPISSTSLNVAGAPPAVTGRQAGAILERMPEVDVPVLLIDAGHLPGPPPSTLVSLVTSTPEFLRDGAVSRDAIEDCLHGIRP
jgi:L-threonylcarbamoyladenylate synthase